MSNVSKGLWMHGLWRLKLHRIGLMLSLLVASGNFLSNVSWSCPINPIISHQILIQLVKYLAVLHRKLNWSEPDLWYLCQKYEVHRSIKCPIYWCFQGKVSQLEWSLTKLGHFNFQASKLHGNCDCGTTTTIFFVVNCTGNKHLWPSERPSYSLTPK